MSDNQSAAPLDRAIFPQPSIVPNADMEPLDPLIGAWMLDGRQHDGFFGPAGDIRGFETFEWLPGGKFLLHRLHGEVGHDEIACIEIWRPDGRAFLLNTFYNDGTSHDWRAEANGCDWCVSSDREIDGKAWKLRCAMTMEDRGRTRTSRWQRSNDGVAWSTFWDVVARRQG